MTIPPTEEERQVSPGHVDWSAAPVAAPDPIVTPDVSPAFIKISNPHPEQPVTKKYIGIIAYSNLIVLGEKAITRDIYLHFHQINDSYQIKVMSEFARKMENIYELNYEMYNSKEPSQPIKRTHIFPPKHPNNNQEQTSK